MQKFPRTDDYLSWIIWYEQISSKYELCVYNLNVLTVYLSSKSWKTLIADEISWVNPYCLEDLFHFKNNNNNCMEREKKEKKNKHSSTDSSEYCVVSMNGEKSTSSHHCHHTSEVEFLPHHRTSRLHRRASLQSQSATAVYSLFDKLFF